MGSQFTGEALSVSLLVPGLKRAVNLCAYSMPASLLHLPRNFLFDHGHDAFLKAEPKTDLTKIFRVAIVLATAIKQFKSGTNLGWKV